MGYLLDKVDQANLANQQDVVRNERPQSVENQPYGMREEELVSSCSRPRIRTTRTSSDRTRTFRPQARRRRRTSSSLYYAPNNAASSIVGDFDKAATRAMVEKYFGPLKQGSRCPSRRQTPPITAPRRAVVQDRVELPRVYVAWITRRSSRRATRTATSPPPRSAADGRAALYKKLVYEKQIAQDVSAQQYSLTLGSVFQIEGDGAAGTFRR
jgi:zinc protease